MDLNITFSEDVKIDILDCLGKKVNDDNLIVEKDDTKQKVLTYDGDEITFEEFGGFKRGSEVFIKKDLISLMKLSKR